MQNSSTRKGGDTATKMCFIQCKMLRPSFPLIALSIVFQTTLFAELSPIPLTDCLATYRDQQQKYNFDIIQDLGRFYDNRWFDSLNVRFVSNWPFGPSRAVACDPGRDLVFCGSGGGVYVIDISAPTLPIQVSEEIHTRNFAYDLQYDQNTQRLYIADAWDSRNEIWDLTDPSNPIRLGSWDTQYFAWRITVDDTFAYVADGLAGIRIINVADPLNPYEVGFCDTLGYCQTGLDAVDTILYVTEFSGLRIFNVAQPSSPYVVGYHNISCVDVVVIDTVAFVCCGEFGLRIFDVADPSNIQEVGVCSTRCYALVLQDSFAYVLGHDTTAAIINISDITNPYEVGRCHVPNTNPRNIAVLGMSLCVPAFHDGLRIIDVLNPANPNEITYFPVPDFANNVVLQDDYAYVGDLRGGLRILDISNPENSYEVGYYQTPAWAYEVEVYDSLAYVCSGDSGLRIINIADPADPSEVGYCETSDIAYSVDIVDTIAYVAADDSGLRVINISDPANPYEISYFDTPGWAFWVDVAGSHAYVADCDSGLRIINISDPTSPYEEGFYITPGPAMGVAVADSFAYVANETEGLRIINVADPANPHEVAYIYTDGWPEGVEVFDSLVIVGAWHGGLRVINVSDPLNPYECGSYGTPGKAVWATMRDDLIYVATGWTGLQIYELLQTGVEEDKGKCYNWQLQLVQNPVRGRYIHIQLNIEQNSNACLTIYNTVGQMAQSISLNSLATGKHSLKIPITNLPNGIYFLRFHTKYYSETKKILLIR